MNFKYIFIVALILLFSRCFSYVGWNPTLGGQVTNAFLLVLLVYCIANFRRIPRSSMRSFVLLLMILPFVSIIGSFTIHGQNVNEGSRATLFTLTYLFYFILYILKIDYQVVLKMSVCFGLFWVIMEIVQQFTYPTVWFATRIASLDNDVEIRNGIYRYNMEGREFGLLLLFYSFQRFLEKPRKKYLAGIILGLTGVYMLATRQVMAASVLCLLYAMLAMHKLKFSSFFMISVIAILIYCNMESLFGDYIEMSEDINEDNIRLLSYDFYGIEYNKGQILPILFGNGVEGMSAYGREIGNMQDMGLFRADIGIVGMYSWYGIFYVLTVLSFFLSITTKKKYTDVYLPMYLVFLLVASVMLYHFGYSPHHIMTLCIILYLIDNSIKSRKNITNIKMP